MNNWVTAVFSPTGGCSKIAAAIAGARMGARVDLTAPVTARHLAPGTPLLVVMPVYVILKRLLLCQFLLFIHWIGQL